MSKIFFKFALALIAVSTSLTMFGARQTTMLPGVVKNFELPHFDDKSGEKEWELFGESATYVNDSRIDVTKIKLDLYEGKQKSEHRATIKSPTAVVNPTTKISESDLDLSVSAKEFDMSGKKWKWNGDTRFVEVFSDVKISVKPQKKNDSITTFESQYASLDYKDKSNIFELKKNVVVKNDEMQVSCEFLHAKTSKENTRGISDIIAKGNVKMLYDKRSASAGYTEIAPEGIVVLTESPQITDLSSRSKLLGRSIVLNKEKRSIEAFSSKKQRATAIIVHIDENKKEQKITILADKISMFQKELKNESQNTFNFDGNVVVITDDFTAKCDNIEARSISQENEKNKLEYIRGNGNIRFENDDGIATSKSMNIIPQKEEIWLIDNVKLYNPKRGTTLTADQIAFFRKQNEGVALTDIIKRNSFVIVKIDETPTLDNSAKQHSNKKISTIIKSKKLNFSKTEKSINFVFTKDVSIVSDDVNATCQKLEVYAETDDKGSSTPKKIVASDKVNVKSKGYSANAEIATIYPRLYQNTSKDAKSGINKFIELSIDPQNPLLRPTITLPPFKSIGIVDDETSTETKQEKTIIKSNKQWLTSTQKEDRYIFEDDIEITGTDMKATCKKMEVVIPNKANSKREISQIIMTNEVKLTQQLKEITCGRADIFTNTQIVVLTENPVVIDREDNSRADGFKITYNHGNKKIQLESDPNAQVAPQQTTTQFEMPYFETNEESTKRATIKLDTNSDRKRRSFRRH